MTQQKVDKLCHGMNMPKVLRTFPLLQAFAEQKLSLSANSVPQSPNGFGSIRGDSSVQHSTQFEVSLGFEMICWAHILSFKATRVRDASGINPNSICGHNSASLDKALGKVEPLGSLGSSPLEGQTVP